MIPSRQNVRTDEHDLYTSTVFCDFVNPLGVLATSRDILEIAYLGLCVFKRDRRVDLDISREHG